MGVSIKTKTKTLQTKKQQITLEKQTNKHTSPILGGVAFFDTLHKTPKI